MRWGVGCVCEEGALERYTGLLSIFRVISNICKGRLVLSDPFLPSFFQKAHEQEAWESSGSVITQNAPPDILYCIFWTTTTTNSPLFSVKHG